MLRCAARGPRWLSSAEGARIRRSWSTASAMSRTGWSSTISSCSIRATCVERWSGDSPNAFCGRGDGTGRSRRRPTRSRAGGGRLRRRPAAHRGPGGAPRRRDAPGRVRVPGSGDDGSRGAGQGPAHRAHRARTGRGDGGPFQSRRVAGRLHQPGRDRDAGLGGRGPSRRGSVQRGHLGPATDRALSRRRSRCRCGRACGAEPPHVDQVGPGRRRWRCDGLARPPDRLDELFERFGPELELESGIPVDLLRLQHALPSYYVHYYYQHDAEVAQQSAPGYRSRADVVAELETRLLEDYRDPALVSKPAALSYRGGAYYSLAAVRLMASLHAGTGDVQVVDMRNDGAIRACPTMQWWRPPPSSTPPVRTLFLSGNCRRRCSGSSSTPRPTNGWR